MRRPILALLLVSALLTLSACAVEGLPATPTVVVEATATVATIETGSAPSGDMPTLSDAAVSTPRGLQYEDVVVGEGAEATAGSLISAHYTGYLEDGTIFDSSVDRGEPFSFPLGAGRVIPGWDEGIVGMKEGGTRLLLIPPALAYGEQGAQGVIPPNATLLFEVQLLTVGEALQAPDAPAAVESYETTESGLEVAIVEPGDGETAAAGDTIRAHYAGFLEDGTRFDTSYLRGEPIEFVLGAGNVIPGWDEGIEGMQVGESRQLRIPPALAYGEAGVEGFIPANATLIFDVTLVSVEKP